MRRYAIQGRDDYRKYNQLAGSLRQLAHRIANLDPSDPFRAKQEDLILEKLFSMGLLGTGGGGRGKLSDVEHKLTVSAFARRRLPVVMTRLRMADHVQSAVTLVEQGVSTLDVAHDLYRHGLFKHNQELINTQHVRVGTDVITDPAYLVSRNMEDFVTWVDSSKIKRNIMKYRDKLDDFELEAL